MAAPTGTSGGGEEEHPAWERPQVVSCQGVMAVGRLATVSGWTSAEVSKGQRVREGEEEHPQVVSCQGVMAVGRLATVSGWTSAEVSKGQRVREGEEEHPQVVSCQGVMAVGRLATVSGWTSAEVSRTTPEERRQPEERIYHPLGAHTGGGKAPASKPTPNATR
jgi:hypothetical protein